MLLRYLKGFEFYEKQYQLYITDKTYAKNTCQSFNNYVDLISQWYWKQNIVMLDESMGPQTWGNTKALDTTSS